MKSAIKALFANLQHGDYKHREWLRDELIAWALYEFNIEFEPEELQIIIPE